MKLIEIKLPENKNINVAISSKIIDIINEHYLDEKHNILAAYVNNILVDLNYDIQEDSTIDFVYYNTHIGHEIYKQSTKLLFIVAVNEFFKDEEKRVKVYINHSLGNGYYFYINKEINQNIVNEIHNIMYKFYESNLPFAFKRSSINKSIIYFDKKGYKDKVLLLKNSTYQFVKIYECRNVSDFAFLPIVPDTSYIKNFKLSFYEPGLILHFPEKKDINQVIQTTTNYKKIFKIYQESKHWSEILNLYNIGLLNQAIIDDRIREVINISEAFHEKKIAAIADTITDREEEVKIILISGPSSSGKTTFAKRLSIHLKVNGINPIDISTDNFFVNREDNPKDDKGNYNFETIDALNLNLLNTTINSLLEGKKTGMPVFNFKAGVRKDNSYELQLSKNQIIILEGIHTLNPKLTEFINNKYKFKIYISPLTQLTIDNYNRIPTRDVRLIRRMVRDNFFRGYSADDTMSRWPSVQAGEDKYIFPYQESADIIFNSSLLYELGVLKDYAIDLIKRIPFDSVNFSEGQRIMNFLLLFLRVRTSEVPKISIIREFIGGGCFKY